MDVHGARGRTWWGTRATRGQASVEFALVVLAFLAVVGALAALWHAARDGALLNRAIEASSHRLDAGGAPDSFEDIVLF